MQKLSNREEQQHLEDEKKGRREAEDFYVIERFREGRPEHAIVSLAESATRETGSGEECYGPATDKAAAEAWIAKRHQRRAEEPQEGEQQPSAFFSPPAVVTDRKPAPYKKNLIDADDFKQSRQDEVNQNRAAKRDAKLWKEYRRPTTIPFDESGLAFGQQQVWNNDQDGGSGGQAGSLEAEYHFWWISSLKRSDP